MAPQKVLANFFRWSENFVSDVECRWTGKADDCQAAFPQRRGNGSNGVFNQSRARPERGRHTAPAPLMDMPAIPT